VAIQFNGDNIASIVDYLKRFAGSSDIFSDIQTVQGKGLRSVGHTISLRSSMFERDVKPDDWIVEDVYTDGRVRKSGDPFPIWFDKTFRDKFRPRSE
jgi:hypothetical protein